MGDFQHVRVWDNTCPNYKVYWTMTKLASLETPPRYHRLKQHFVKFMMLLLAKLSIISILIRGLLPTAYIPPPVKVSQDLSLVNQRDVSSNGLTGGLARCSRMLVAFHQCQKRVTICKRAKTEAVQTGNTEGAERS